jgi:hypothetical protein
MAKVRVITQGPIYDGMALTFKAPCDCTAVDGLRVYYDEVTEDRTRNVSADFDFVDAHGQILSGLGNLFMEGSYVRVILDTVNNSAYLQNADTNSYLEEKLKVKKGQGNIVQSGATVGMFFYVVFGNIIQMNIDINAISSAAKLELVDITGELPQFEQRECFYVQLNGNGTTTGGGEFHKVFPAELEMEFRELFINGWEVNGENNIDTCAFKGTVTLFSTPLV